MFFYIFHLIYMKNDIQKIETTIKDYLKKHGLDDDELKFYPQEE